MAEEQSSTPAPGAQKWRGAAPAAPQAGPYRPPRKSRALRVFILLAVMLALGGALAAWLLLLRPFHPPFLLTIPITEYTSPHYPPNALAEQDSNALLALFPGGDKAFDNQERDLLLRKMQSLQKGQSNQTVVVHLSALARADADGVSILPANANPDDRATWLSLGDFLKPLLDCPAKHKLLILDIMRPLADSRLGVLANDVPDRLQPILEDAVKRDPHLWVLCACSPGQVSLASEDLGQSVFGYYLVQGLNGWADLYNPDHQHNGKVSVRELAEFVAARVDRWAMHNRNVHQTPFLLGPDGDFDLVVLPKGQALKPETLPDSPGPYPDWLRAGWDLRDQWLADQTSVFAPRLFHRLEAVLFRAEQRWRGGIDPKRIQDDLNADIQDLTTRAQAARNKDLPAPHSLALAYTRGLKADPALREDLATLLARLDAMPPLKPEELDQGKKEFLTKFKGTPAELAGAAFDVAVEDVNLSQKKIALLLELVHTPKPAPPASAEILFLERLAQLKADPKQWPVEAVHQALLGVREEQQAIAALTMEPRALPWVRNLFAGVADKRHQGEGLLFQDDPDARPQAKAPFADAENQAYELNQMIQALQKALEYRDQALVFLPAYLPALTSQMDGGDDEETLVRSTVEAFQPLNEMLTKPPELSSLDDLRDRRNELQRLATILRDPLLRLREPFGSKHVAILAAKTPEGVSDLDELVAIDGLFRTPCLNAADRLKLWQRRQELTQKLLQETHEQDKVDDDPKKGKATKSPDRVDVKAASQRVRQRAARRANLALSLFRLGGFDKVEDLNKEITQTAANSAGDWYSEGDTLRRIWADQLPDQFQRLLKKRNLPAAGRLSHILDPFAKEGLDLFGDPRRDPALQLHLRETRAVWQWLADRFQAEGRSLAEPGVYGDFYQKTAQEYQRYAR